MQRIFLVVLAMMVNMSVFGQNGFLRGTVIDSETGEGLFGATISQQGTTKGTSADFDGNYSLSLTPGTHTIEFRFFSYETKTISEIEIKAGEVTSIDVQLGESTTELQEVVVTAKQLRDNDVALMTVQKKSANTVDGISSQAFKKIGDSNLSAAMKRVTGVSVQGGRYVYVRGLGDRYTKTTLNGMSIPGLDPERNDVQIDIFPTSILENVMVYKTYSPDLAGDFTGGMVNVETKGFPEEKITSVSFGLGYNPKMHFNKDNLTYDGGNLDFLGFDDGTRKLPFNRFTDIPDEALEDPELESLTRSFNPQMAAQRKTNFMNSSLSFNHGNQIEKEKATIGYGVIFNYQNKSEYYENNEIGFYTRAEDKDMLVLEKDRLTQGQLGRNNTLWSALVTGAIKFDNHEFNASLLRTQNGISATSDRTVLDFEETGQTILSDVLTYTQRSITNNILSGKHNFDKFKLEWANSFTIARIYDPDFRVTSIGIDAIDENNIEYSIDGGRGGNSARFFRDLQEFNENFKIDLTYDLQEKNKLKFGAAALMKFRDFETDNFLVNNNSSGEGIKDNPDWLFAPDNIWNATTEEGTYIAGNFEAANNFEAKSNVFSAYAMADMRLMNSKLRAIYGARLEKSDMYYTGQNNFGSIKYNNEKTFDELDILPAVNLVYSISENANVRGAYGRTLARPSFKEKSIAQIADPVAGMLFNGNIDLEKTVVDNFDIRFENFFGRGEMISTSFFYKKFDGHIEMTRFENEPRQITPRNIAGSFVYGIELELRKNINVIEGLSFGSNVSISKTEVDITKVYINDSKTRTEYDVRMDQARTGEAVKDNRPMAGQAPYLINAFFNYGDLEGRNNLNISYNVQGESLSIVGSGNLPDVYNKPFNSLNFNASRTFGLDQKSKITFGISNILNASRKQVYKNYGSAEEIFSIFELGTTFSIKYGLIF